MRTSPHLVSNNGYKKLLVCLRLEIPNTKVKDEERLPFGTHMWPLQTQSLLQSDTKAKTVEHTAH